MLYKLLATVILEKTRWSELVPLQSFSCDRVVTDLWCTSLNRTRLRAVRQARLFSNVLKADESLATECVSARARLWRSATLDHSPSCAGMAFHEISRCSALDTSRCQ